MDDVQAYWKLRSHSYDQLEWVQDSGYMGALLRASRFAADDIVMDLGTGTGVVAHRIAPHVAYVVGVDISPDMLVRAKRDAGKNEVFLLGDACQLTQICDEYFTKVIARLLFHHLLDKVPLAAAESYRVLRPGGQLIIAEGTPPNKECREWYTAMFRLKEDRLTFMESDLEMLMTQAGFTWLRTEIHVTPQCSIKNWLAASGLPSSRQQRIMRVHQLMPDYVKAAYNATITQDDCLLDMRFATVVGEKQ